MVKAGSCPVQNGEMADLIVIGLIAVLAVGHWPRRSHPESKGSHCLGGGRPRCPWPGIAGFRSRFGIEVEGNKIHRLRMYPTESLSGLARIVLRPAFVLRIVPSCFPWG